MSREPEGPASGVGRILVVEDSPSARRLLQDVLLRLGAQLPDLRMVGTVVEALTVFAQWRPDVVFLDVELRAPPSANLPPPSPQDPKDGVELATLLRSRNPSVRIIVCSATDPSDPRLGRLETEGGIEFIVKPLLASKVSDVLARSAPPRTHRST